jgi:hypothetical protein
VGRAACAFDGRRAVNPREISSASYPAAITRPIKKDPVVRKRSKIYRRKVSGYAIEPPERLLSLLNDASVSHKQRHAIAKKLLPYFHEKPKPLRPEELDDSLLENHPRENEDPGSASDERERLRKMIFDRFD